MTATRTLRVKTFVLLVLIVCFASAGNILLSKGMKRVGTVNNWSLSALVGILARTLTSATIWLGIASLLVFFVFYLLVLSWADYSYVMPASAAGYAVVPLLGYILLGEVVTSTRWAGVATICLGVALVGRTSPSTTERR